MPAERPTHDAFYKDFFSNPEMVRALLQSFAPASILEEMDLSSLQPYRTESVAEDQRQRRGDIIWRVKLREGHCFLLFLLEFQSGQDWWMAVRILVYTALLWQDVIKADNLKPGDKLPPVLPIVLYNGSREWKAPTSIADLLPRLNPALGKYQPAQDYFLLDEGRIPEKTLLDNKSLATMLIRFERIGSMGEALQIMSELSELLRSTEYLSLHRTFISWLGRSVFRNSEISGDILNCNTVQEANAMLADIAYDWEAKFRDEGIAIGREEGFSKGKQEGFLIGEREGFSRGKIEAMRDVLEALLITRFGDVPDKAMDYLAEIDNADTLKNLTLEVSRADSLQGFLDILYKY